MKYLIIFAVSQLMLFFVLVLTMPYSVYWLKDQLNHPVRSSIVVGAIMLAIIIFAINKFRKSKG